MQFETVIRLLLKHLRLILVCGLVAGLAALVVTTLIPPTFAAEADLVMIKSGADVTFDPKFKSISEFNVAQTVVDQAARRKALTTIAASPELATAVIAKVGAQLSAEQRVPANLARAVTARSDSDVIQIIVRSDTADKAALIANAWAAEYATRVNELYSENTLTPDEIQAQADAAKRDYDAKEAALISFLNNSRVNELNRSLQEKLQILGDSLTVSNQMDRLLADARSLRERLATGGTTLAPGDQLAALLLEANSFNTAAKLFTGGQSSGANTPLNLELHIDQLNPGATLNEHVSWLDALITALEKRRQNLQTQDVKSQQQAVNTLQAQLEQENARQKELTRARDLAWSTLDTLSSKVAEVKVSAQVGGSVVRLAVSALAPLDPIEPRRVLYTLLASGMGLAAGVLLALASEFRRAFFPARQESQPGQS